MTITKSISLLTDFMLQNGQLHAPKNSHVKWCCYIKIVVM